MDCRTVVRMVDQPTANVVTDDMVPEVAREMDGETESAMRVFSDPTTPVPEVHLLSNGRYHVVVTSAGSGYTRWHDLAVTRWREDATRDHWGTFVYVRDLATGEYFSTAYQPTVHATEGYEAIFTQARAEFRQRHADLEIHTEICVSPEDDVELRRIKLTNRSTVGATILCWIRQGSFGRRVCSMCEPRWTARPVRCLPGILTTLSCLAVSCLWM